MHLKRNKSGDDDAGGSDRSVSAIEQERAASQNPENLQNNVENDVDNAEASSNNSNSETDLTDEELEEAKKFALCDYGSCGDDKARKCPYMKSKTICEGEFIGSGGKLRKNMEKNLSSYVSDTNNIIEKSSILGVKFKVQHHHLISSEQCYTQMPELVKLGNFYGYNINNENNGICAPSDGNYSSETTVDNKIAHAFDAMAKTNVQWHVGSHSMNDVKGRLEKISKKVNDALLTQISSSLQGYDVSVMNLLQKRILKVLQPEFNVSCRCDNKEQEKEDFITKMNATSKEIYAKLASYNKSTANTRQWFYISKMALCYAFDSLLKYKKDIFKN